MCYCAIVCTFDSGRSSCDCALRVVLVFTTNVCTVLWTLVLTVDDARLALHARLMTATCIYMSSKMHA
jgi:hypothetical protein